MDLHIALTGWIADTRANRDTTPTVVEQILLDGRPTLRASRHGHGIGYFTNPDDLLAALQRHGIPATTLTL